MQAALGRGRYECSAGGARGRRNGHRERQLTGTFGTETVCVPRARIENEAGKVAEWRLKILRRYRRLAKNGEDREKPPTGRFPDERSPDRFGISGRHRHPAGGEARSWPRRGRASLPNALSGLFGGAVSEAVSRTRAAR